jgi:SH3-like domain-containing protein
MQHAFRFPMRLLSLVLALLALPPIASQVFAQKMVSVVGKEVNLRTGPGTQHRAEWTLSPGYPLEVIGERGDWLQVRDFENDRGWIHRPLTGTEPHFIVKVKVANVRSEPSTGSRILGRFAYGDILKTLERRTDWVKVQRQGGLRGWVAQKLLWGW